MNPRRPSPEDLKSAKPEAGFIDYLGVKDDFMVWLRSRGLQWDHYVSDFLQYMDNFCKPIKEPMDLVALFVDLNMSQKRHLVNGLRNLFKFYEFQGLADKQYLDLLRKNLPKTSIGVDLYIPSEAEIIESLERLKEEDKNKRYFGLYNPLLDSGLRLVEGVRFLNMIVSGEANLERQQGFHTAPIGYFRGTKLAYYGFSSDCAFDIIRKAGKPLRYKKLMGTVSS